MSATVASITLGASVPGEEDFEISLEIGAPYPDPSGAWRCPVSLHPLYAKLSDITGEDSFQALCLAIALAQDLLHDFIEKGGSLTARGDEFPLDAYSMKWQREGRP
ncbi:hypothetical protein [Phenylobacterium sp.]|uniref:DUF6968 family protein n=1 Tax=Phenylobacterium sp. TaxID=1871053 RepID=UPI00273771CD|nr:hypothetical protein [Phenylobacterium sp.]MDP3854524.1 hypothetical protein [Phenylobacterium sp.]